jgi:hypothetical protein
MTTPSQSPAKAPSNVSPTTSIFPLTTAGDDNTAALNAAADNAALNAAAELDEDDAGAIETLLQRQTSKEFAVQIDAPSNNNDDDKLRPRRLPTQLHGSNNSLLTPTTLEHIEATMSSRHDAIGDDAHRDAASLMGVHAALSRCSVSRSVSKSLPTPTPTTTTSSSVVPDALLLKDVANAVDDPADSTRVEHEENYVYEKST